MDKVILITGASRGLGLSLAKLFVSEGAIVFGISKSKRTWKSARATVPDAKKFVLLQADLACEADVKACLKTILKKTKRIDVVINNAGYGGALANLDSTSLKEFEKHLALNLSSVFLVCKSLLPVLRKQSSGLILNISSMAGRRAVPRLAAYSASKFGVLALTQAIAKENVDHGIKCITVCPGGMNTEMRAALFGKADAEKQQSPDFVAKIISQIVSGKMTLESGSDITIRHGKITAINVPPAN